MTVLSDPVLSDQVLSDTVLNDTTVPGPACLGQAFLRRLVAAVAARPDSWGELVRFDAGRRWYRRLELADDHEVWLLSWLPGQGTGFHDHGRAAGAFAVAQGRVRERTVAAGDGQARHRTVARGGIRSFGAGYVHDVANAFAEPAVAVHAYSPPLTVMRRYELTESGLVRTATDRAERDW
jgi:predicted metal-dependent enzyme (double-stranded beta helix superfamily)